jgi:hypothetical protein
VRREGKEEEEGVLEDGVVSARDVVQTWRLFSE